MGEPLRVVALRARIFRMKKRAASVQTRAYTHHSGRIERRQLKRAIRLRDKWIADWFRLMGIDPHAPAMFDPTPEFAAHQLNPREPGGYNGDELYSEDVW